MCDFSTSPGTKPLGANAPDAQAETLLCRARNGDGDAFARLCGPHRKRVWNVVASVSRSADTDDLAQEAIVRAWAALGQFRGNASVFGAWLCRIAVNAAHDYQKSAWRRRVWVGFGDRNANETRDEAPFEERAAFPGPHEEALRRETARLVRAAVLRLGPKERLPIWLVYFEEFSLAEVARMEDVPESTIRSRIKKGLSRLQNTLAAFGFAEGQTAESSANAALWSISRTNPAGSTAASELTAPPSAADWKGCAA